MNLNPTAGLIVAVIIFAGGFGAGRMSASYAEAQKDIVAKDAGAENTAHNIQVKAAGDEQQQDRILVYRKGVETDDNRADVLLDSVLRHFDGLRDNASTTEQSAPTATGNSCGVEREEARRLSRQLRSTLEKYGAEANRANQYTRLLNECIGQLEGDRKLESLYR